MNGTRKFVDTAKVAKGWDVSGKIKLYLDSEGEGNCDLCINREWGCERRLYDNSWTVSDESYT